MERNAHYAAVGLATLVLFLGVVLFVVWLARFQFARDYDVYDILFYGPVRGVSEGGEVHFNGIKVGEVTALHLDPNNPNRVIARVRMTSDVPVKTDSRAQLEPQGITGVNYIQISAGAPKAPLLKKTVKEGQVPVIQSQPGPLSELLSGGGTVLAKAVETLNRVNQVLSDENIHDVSATVHDVRQVADELNARKAMLAKAEVAVENAAEATREAAELARSSRGLVEGDGARAVRNIDKAAANIDAAAKNVRTITEKMEGPASDFATTGLPQLTSAVVSLQEASESLRQLVEEARRSPQGLIAKPPAKEVKVKP
jgi:phospholipid/cholesterol/gamma-HCH transport system substrate-binding protein